MTDRFIRLSAAATVVAIGAIAAFISYRHALDVATAHGESGATGRLVPLTIDGLVYVASMVLLDSARRQVPPPALARLALALGIGATVAVNVLHGVAHGVVGALIAAWPAVTLVLAVELLMGMIRRVRSGDEVSAALDIIVRPDAEPDEGEPWDGPAGLEWWDALPAVEGAVAITAPDPVASEPDLAPVVATARDRFAEVLASGSVPSVRAIRRELRVGHPRAVRVREALTRASTPSVSVGNRDGIARHASVQGSAPALF